MRPSHSTVEGCLPPCPRHKVLTSPTTVPCAFCLCVGVDCRRRRKRRPVRPRGVLPTAPATVTCASGLCGGADCRRRRKRRPVRPRGGLPTARATVLCTSGLCVGGHCFSGSQFSFPPGASLLPLGTSWAHLPHCPASMFPLAGPPPDKSRTSGCTTSVGKAKRKRSVKHKRGSCSKRNRHGVVKAQRPADSSVAGTSCGSSAAAAGAAAAAVASGAAAHHGDGAQLGAPVVG